MKTINIVSKLLLLSFAIFFHTAINAEIKITYYIPDASGSPVAATDEQGNVKWRAHRMPFGTEVNKDPASSNNHIGFTGHVHDSSTGLTYMGARYYDPIVGRFMGMDPAGVDPEDPRTFNRFAYANNNPYTFIDPDGRNPKRGLTYLKGNPFGPESAGGIGGSYTGPKGPFQRLFSSGGGRSFAETKGVGSVAKSQAAKLPAVKKAVNSNLPHARDQSVVREVFPNAKAATSGLKALTKDISKNGFPKGSILDGARADRVLVPVGNNGLAAFQVGKNGTAKLKTVLIAK